MTLPPTSLSLCIPVLNRYDCLRTLLLSLHTIRRARRMLPTSLHLVNNGRNPHKLREALTVLPGEVEQVGIYTPHVALGLAASWNFFLRYAPPPWLICNDDVTFSAESIDRVLTTPGDFVSPLAGTCAAFSCFLWTAQGFDQLLRDEGHKRNEWDPGYFDEQISPGYAYFEDNDYAERLKRAGIPITGVDAGVEHAGSQTLQMYTKAELAAHHQKFEIAKANFRAKWGFVPREERP